MLLASWQTWLAHWPQLLRNCADSVVQMQTYVVHVDIWCIIVYGLCSKTCNNNVFCSAILPKTSHMCKAKNIASLQNSILNMRKASKQTFGFSSHMCKRGSHMCNTVFVQFAICVCSFDSRCCTLGSFRIFANMLCKLAALGLHIGRLGFSTSANLACEQVWFCLYGVRTIVCACVVQMACRFSRRFAKLQAWLVIFAAMSCKLAN